jgi:hypothetical protein
MFILLVKVVMFTMHIWYPFLGTITNAAITALWIASMYGQMGPDHSDPSHPSNIAWYISKSCSYAIPSGNHHYCLIAKGTYATTVIMVYACPYHPLVLTLKLTQISAIFFLNFLLGVYSLIPTSAQRAASKIEIDDMQTMSTAHPKKPNTNPQTKDSPISDNNSDKEWEMKAVPKTQTPYTPRTLAFNTLDRQLPLRAQGAGKWA